MLKGKILITGGTGTLGHAIVRQAIRESWDCEITIYARSELRMAAMRRRYPKLRYVLGDVRDYDRTLAAIAGHEGVIHAAAMKRIPECEEYPSECFDINVNGSNNVATACILNGVEWVVGVSTDKACASITTYGASKQFLESCFVAAAMAQEGTSFHLVRYGNVVASNGSVVTIWRDQADSHQPLTITDPEMTRFWMSPTDAVKLIVASTYLASGLIMVPKMSSIKMLDLAQQLFPERPTNVTGLRSREKLHEDLVHPDEPSTDANKYFIIGGGDRGRQYNSLVAPRMSIGTFMDMLADAEELEK